MIIAPTVLVTASALLYGYWLAQKHHRFSDCDFCKELSFDDAESDTPIFDAIDMEYGYSNRLTKPLSEVTNEN